MLVFDLLSAVQESGAVTEGPRKFIRVMHRDARPGGEAFQENSHDGRMVTDSVAQCFGCHPSRSNHAYVFSSDRP